MSAKVTGVVLNWNGWRDTLACLDSLVLQSYSHFDVLVVDNGSSDDSVAQIRAAHPQIELIETGANLGFGGGCNVGIRTALDRGADWIWLLNSDAIAAETALSELTTKAGEDGAVAAVGSVVFDAGTLDRVQLWGGGQVNLWRGRSVHRTTPGPIDFVSGSSVLLRAAALEDVGLFDQGTYFMYWEDTDLSFRLRHAGWALAVAESAHVWHEESSSLGKGNPLLDEYFTRSAVRFLRRFAPMPWISICVMLSSMVLKKAATGRFARLRGVLRGAAGA